jgi:hypothetical protein
MMIDEPKMKRGGIPPLAAHEDLQKRQTSKGLR